MKSIFFFLAFSTSFSVFAFDYCKCASYSLEVSFEQSEFSGLVKITTKDKGIATFKLLEVFKGNAPKLLRYPYRNPKNRKNVFGDPIFCGNLSYQVGDLIWVNLPAKKNSLRFCGVTSVVLERKNPNKYWSAKHKQERRESALEFIDYLRKSKNGNFLAPTIE